MRGLAARLLAVGAAVAADLAGAQDEEAVGPPPEVPASIACVTRGLEPAGVGGGRSILFVGVRNPLARAAEPLSFRLTLPGPPARELLVARVPLPHVGRRGRPVAPGGREDYALPVPLGTDALREVSVAVETAVFLDGDPVAIALPRVSGVALREGRDAVRLENSGPFAVDVVLEATYGADGLRSLHAVRLAAGGTVTWDVPPPSGWSAVAGARPPRALEVRVVDACALEVEVVSDEPARDELARACAGWMPERAVADGAHGLFELDHRGGGRAFHARGRFEVVGEGLELTALTPWRRPLDGEVAGEALETLFHVRARRGPVEDVVDRAAPRVLARAATETILGVETLPALGLDAAALVGVRDGRVAWTSGPSLGEPPWRRWWTRPFGAGYVRFGVDLHEDSPVDLVRPDRVTRWSHEAEPGPSGRRSPLPVELRLRDLDERGKIRSATRLAVAWVGAGARAARSEARDDAEARAALREAWERPLRYEGPLTWRARFELLAPAPREDWGERDFVSGAVVIEGLRSGGWIRATFSPVGTVDGRRPRAEGADDGEDAPAGGEENRRPPPPRAPLGDDQRREIAEGLEERLGAWTRLDFAHRPPFELLFGDARVERLGADFVVEGAPVRRVRVEDGLPVQVIGTDGTRLDVEYVASPDGILPVRVQRRGRQLEIQHVLVGERWLPRRLVLIDFPPAGGLETLLFEDWRPR